MRDGFVDRYTRRAGGRRPAGGRGGVPGLHLLAGRLPSTCWAGTPRRGGLFERLLALRNDVGLLAEEYDPQAGRLVGNFPQAFSHIGLVNTAMNLSPAAATPAEQPGGGLRYPRVVNGYRELFPDLLHGFS